MRKKLLASVLTMALALSSLVACGGGASSGGSTESGSAGGSASEQTASSESGGGYHFEIVSKGFQADFFQSVLKGAQDKADELGDTINFVGPATESDVADQVQMLENAINAKPDALGLATLDTEACLESLKNALNAGIPVIGHDSGVPNAPEGSVLANCATDNYVAGGVAAEELYNAIKDRIAAANSPVRIGLIAQDSTSESHINRGRGFLDKMGELLTGDGYTVELQGNEKFLGDTTTESTSGGQVIIEVRVPAQVTSELLSIETQALLNEDDTIGCFGTNQTVCEAMVTANETLQRFGVGENDVVAVAFDSGAVIKGAVRDKIFCGAITQAPVAMGEAMVQALHDAAAGKEVTDVDTGCQFYTAETMDDPEIAQNLYD